MTVTPFYPNADTESTSVDGWTLVDGVNVTWANLLTTAGQGNNDSGATMLVGLESSGTTNQWKSVYNGFLLFDTSDIGSDTVSAVTLGVVCTSMANEFSDSLAWNTTNPASNTTLENSDHVRIGNVKQSSDILMSNLTVDSATYNTLTGNSTAVGNVSTDGISKFGVGSAYIISQTEPSWLSQKATQLVIATAEETLTSDKRPKLTVTHAIAFTPKVMMF
jgi:hypothetical protein